MEVLIGQVLGVFNNAMNIEAQNNQIEAQKFFLEGRYQQNQYLEIGILAALFLLVVLLIVLSKK